MTEFYQSLSISEKQRINLLEPFDEFEDFYDKCIHYTLVLAGKGVCDQNVSTRWINAKPKQCNTLSCDSVTSAIIQR